MNKLSIKDNRQKMNDGREEDLIRTVLKMSTTAILSSLGIILSSIVVLVPNFEFISVTIFLISLLFGVYYGLISATVIALIYEFIVTPIYGASGLLIPFKLLCYFMLAFLTGLFRKKIINLSFWELGIIGSFFALIYDIITTFGGLLVILITNLQTNLPANISFASFLSLMIFGAPITITHIIGNFVLFSLTRTLVKWIISAFRHRGVKMLMIEPFNDFYNDEKQANITGETV
ncbi:MAG: hypothetical protein KAS63_00580 [Candidatus Heimdallarchaeota archaeon]|nr:hypothetical protein [Candidatus Heimdallarchaeota archaeon]MCK4953838.1 hypothetical protein [Candidatus Heimdallarchaeota archaeon]